MGLISLLDYVGVALFAATGAITASRKELDIVAFLFLALMTGIGGGTVRDLILDVPVFWLEQHFFILACVVAAVLVYFTAHLIEYRYRLLLWLDAVALAAYAVFGAVKGLAVTGSPLVAVITGAMTAALGGIMRDVIAGEPTVISRKEIYVLAAVAGAAGFVTASGAGLPGTGAAFVGFCLAFGIRAGALIFGWSLPPYRSRPGRPVGGAGP